MRSLISILVVLLVGLILVACGEGKSDPTEAGLRLRAEAAAEKASSAETHSDAWKEVYKFLTPEYRKRCGPSSIFTTLLHGSFFVGTIFQVSNVTVDGTRGQVDLTTLYRGNPVELDHDGKPEYWIYEDGQWFLESSGYWMDKAERSGEGCLYGRVWFGLD